MLKTRPIISITLGYMLGIIIGLYFKFSIVFFYAIIFLVMIILNFIFKNLKHKKYKKLNILSIKRYIRYLKIIFTKKVIVIIIISSIISNTITLFQNSKYNNLYNFEKGEEINIIGKIVSNVKQKEYKDIYIIKVETINNSKKFKNTKLYLNIKKNKNIQLEYGDKINLKGNFSEISIAKNYKGFNYKEYLKTLKIYGTIEVCKCETIEKNTNGLIFQLVNNLKIYIKKCVNCNLDKDVSNIVLGLTIGYTEEIEEEIKSNFSDSNISHILAISGMHINYLTIAISFLLNNIVGKRKSKIYASLLLIFYMFITGGSPSVVRASISAIIVLLSEVFHRKSDFLNNICLSLLILLIYNPYLIKSVSLLLSFGGTIGIAVFNKNILKLFEMLEENHNEKNKRKKKNICFNNKKRILIFYNKIKEGLSVCISASLIIFPIIAIEFNKIPVIGLLIGIFVSFIIGPIIIICFVYIILNKLKILSNIVTFLINIILKITELGGNLKFNKIYVVTPYIIEIIIYYIIIFLSFYLFKLYHLKNLNITQKRIKNTISLIKYKFRSQKINFIKRFKKEKFKKVLAILLIITLIISNIILVRNQIKSLKIYFINVGQGDSTLIITKNNKRILIDGGGSEFGSYNVGKNILLPYLLDRRIKVLDYVIISHFDIDHVGGILYLLQEIKVKKVIIGKQYEANDNLNQFLKIAKENKVEIVVVDSGNKINIEKNLYFDVLWPNSLELISENAINNNALVLKLNYINNGNNFTAIFTGDIEEIAEKKLIEKYSNSNTLKSDILKVAHHGSKTSSTKEFLELVNPKIALIGVGEDNLYGHPNLEVIQRLKNLRCKYIQNRPRWRNMHRYSEKNKN